jgi:hypothetical protein
MELARTLLIALGLLVGVMTSRGAGAWQAPSEGVAQWLALGIGADSSRPRPNTETHLLTSAPGDPVAFFGKRGSGPRPLPQDGVGPDSISADASFIALGAHRVARAPACLIEARPRAVALRGTRTTRGPPTATVSMLPITI